MRILGIVAHADDEISFAGLLRKATISGGQGIVVCFTGDDLRKKEFMESCEILGVKGIFLGYPDLGLYNLDCKQALIQLMSIIREFKPHIIATMSRFDYHPDHKKIVELTADAVEFASHGTPDVGWMTKKVLMFESSNLFPRPDYLINIDEEMEIKLNALSRYASQLESSHKRGYYLAHTDKLAQLRGVMGGCKYAEACMELKLGVHGNFYCESKTINQIESWLGEGK
jgi:LmbE family N-acetylglucosaminyl deacetylase